MTPTVSVILPVYNAARTLPEAVESVRAQQFDSMEIIVVDDGSTDDSREVVANLGSDIRFFSQQNSGPAAARNVAIRESRGEIIAMIDADDVWPRGKLALQMDRLLANPEVDVVSGRIELVSLDGTPVGPQRLQTDDRKYAGVNVGAALFRRRVFDCIGLFDESLRFGEDQDWFLRAREQGLNILVLQEVTLIYRRHKGNMTHQKTASELLIPLALKKSLDRRRKMAKEAENLSSWASLDEKA